MMTSASEEGKDMDEKIETAKDLISKFKGGTYALGIGVLDQVVPLTAQDGK
jgi:hypothetical protein